MKRNKKLPGVFDIEEFLFFLCAAIDPADAALDRAFFRHASA